MNNTPIIFIDDDVEDLEIMKEMADAIYVNPVMLFNKPHKALDFLRSSDKLPLFILCDINMPKLSGFEVWQELLGMAELPFKEVPFILLSTSRTEAEVILSDKLHINGFYRKSNSFRGMEETMGNIKSHISNLLYSNEKLLM